MGNEYTRRLKQKGRRTSQPFVSIPNFVLQSEQWATLTGNEVKLLMELAGKYNGKNNGDLSAAYGMLESRGWKSKETIQRAIEGLEEKQWVIRTRQGGRHVGCNLFAITFWPVDACPEKHPCAAEHKPGHLWKNKNGPPIIGNRNPDNREQERFDSR